MPYIILIMALGLVGATAPYWFPTLALKLKTQIFRQREHVSRELELMFIFISVENLQKIKWGFAGVLGALGLVVTWEMTPPGPLIAAMIFAGAGYWGPELTILYLRKRRRAAFSEQLVDGLVLMASGLRAGYTLQQAIEMLIREMPAPLSQEFRLVQREWITMNVDVDTALRNCVERTKDEDLELVVNAIQITRQLGGNLAEVFDRIVSMVRDRKILHGKAEALTAEGKMQASVVGLLPYVFGFFMIKVNPEMMKLMWTTLPGILAMGAVVVLDTVGYIWVRKASMIKY
ncbi:MAG: type II secretion system F family protein [Verrucomicrobia bacterium]|nr:type II secretion system F family protein [Verrucomicrobiota bacterium]